MGPSPLTARSSMSRNRVLAGLGVLVVASVVLAVWWRHGSDDTARHPLLMALLIGPAKEDGEQHSVFFKSLSALARPQGFDLDRNVDEGYAVRVRSGQQRYVVAVLWGWGHYIPSWDTQYLLLFSPDGELLDTLSCSINCRLTRVFIKEISGTFRTDVLDADDDARLVLRYVPEPGGRIAGNFSHWVNHQGRSSAYPWEKGYGWGRENEGFLRTADMEREGLCRVAIRDGRFSVLFPQGE